MMSYKKNITEKKIIFYKKILVKKKQPERRRLKMSPLLVFIFIVVYVCSACA